jgi:DHA1 family multidrug resistance protein-like MFS transporter
MNKLCKCTNVVWSYSLLCFGVDLNAIHVGSYVYIINSYGEHTAIDFSSITMMRCLIAGCRVMAVQLRYIGIGVHWIMTLLGTVALSLAPALYLLWENGEYLPLCI